jgi:hypothetical protein
MGKNSLYCFKFQEISQGEKFGFVIGTQERANPDFSDFLFLWAFFLVTLSTNEAPYEDYLNLSI